MFLGIWGKGFGGSVCVCEDPGGGLTDDLVLGHSLGLPPVFWTVEAHGDRGFHEGLVERGELTAGREVTPFNQLFVWTLA